jgi:tetratricopeptide (TPR) repeat protein
VFVMVCCALNGACASDDAATLEAPAVDNAPPPRTKDVVRSHQVWCVKLAERLSQAASAREVIQSIRISPRFDADAETVAPLTECIATLARARSPAVRGLVRPLAHGFGLAVVQSRALDEDEKRVLLADGGLPPDVAGYWRGRLALRTNAPAAAIESLTEALVLSPGLVAARLALARAHLDAGAPADALAAIDEDAAAAHPRYAAAVRGRAHRALGDLAAANTALALATEEGSPPAPEDADALALRSLAADSEKLHCLRGDVLADAGDADAAVAAYERGGCPDRLVQLLLRQERFFDVLIALRRAGLHDPATSLRAYEALGQPASALAIVERSLTTCEQLQGGERCGEHRAEADRLRALAGAGGHDDADFPGVLAHIAPAAPPADADADADADGLFDVDEARLGLSPALADSDGDGTDDGADPMPTSPGRAARDADGEIVTLLLGDLLFGEQDALIAGEPEPLDGKILFIVSDVPPLAALTTPVRLAVLPRAALAPYSERWGPPLNLIELGAIIRAPAGDRVLVEYRVAMSAGAYLARHDGTRWSVEPVTARSQLSAPSAPVDDK